MARTPNRRPRIESRSARQPPLDLNDEAVDTIAYAPYAAKSGGELVDIATYDVETSTPIRSTRSPLRSAARVLQREYPDAR